MDRSSSRVRPQTRGAAVGQAAVPARVGRAARRTAPRGRPSPEHQTSARRSRSCSRALSLTESVVSIAVVGVMLVAALNTVGASQTTQRAIGDRSRGMLLAEDLMSEITQQNYEDPDLAPGSFGLGGDEVGDGSRALWEDVDDYDGWSATPPEEKDGTALSDFDGWRRAVAVDWVDSTDSAVVSVSDTGVKRITVTVFHNTEQVASLTALRTRDWQYQPEDE